MMYYNMNDITSSQRFHHASMAVLDDRLDDSRVVMQAMFMIDLDHRRFSQYVSIDDGMSTTSVYYKLRSLSTGHVDRWFFDRDMSIEDDLSKMTVFHDAVMANLTDERCFVDDTRRWYTSADHDVKCDQGIDSKYRCKSSSGTSI